MYYHGFIIIIIIKLTIGKFFLAIKGSCEREAQVGAGLPAR